MKIAILGAGFAGLSAAWNLLHESQFSIMIDLFDPIPLGHGASGLSSGLLNPYGGMRAKRAWEAVVGMNATHDMITASTTAIHQPVILSKGIFRPAISLEQMQDFKKVAELYSDVEWWDEITCRKKIPLMQFGDLQEGGGIFIKSGLTLDVQAYLEGLWQACAKAGARWIQKEITSNEELAPYDKIIICTGYRTVEQLNLPIQSLKGQMLKIEWPSNIPPLPFSLVGKGYLSMLNEKTCLAGATYERNFTTAEPILEIAKPLIMEKILPFFPMLKDCKILGCFAGVRGSTANHLPIVDKVSDNAWVFSALGSKGLLWHGFLGKRLSQAILHDDPLFIPDEVKIKH